MLRLGLGLGLGLELELELERLGMQCQDDGHVASPT